MAEYQTFGDRIRALRIQRQEPLRIVAAAVSIDSTLLSKIERGERFPTNAQLSRFAEYFGTSPDGLHAQVIAERIIADYGHTAATLRAIKIVKEQMLDYDDTAG